MFSLSVILRWTFLDISMNGEIMMTYFSTLLTSWWHALVGCLNLVDIIKYAV